MNRAEYLEECKDAYFERVSEMLRLSSEAWDEVLRGAHEALGLPADSCFFINAYDKKFPDPKGETLVLAVNGVLIVEFRMHKIGITVHAVSCEKWDIVEGSLVAYCGPPIYSLRQNKLVPSSKRRNHMCADLKALIGEALVMYIPQYKERQRKINLPLIGWFYKRKYEETYKFIGDDNA